MQPAERLHPDRTAVVVIDVQNDFCHPQGISAGLGKDLSGIERAVARLADFLPAARTAGVPVVFVRNLHSPNSDTPEWLARHASPGRAQTCQVGTWGAEFYGVAPLDGDIVVDKNRYNAFTRTRLEEVLDGLGRRSLLFCGVASNTCVETSLRDAVCRDYLATMVEDCCGAYSAEAHHRAVTSVSSGFGLVATSTDIVEEWSSRAYSAAVQVS
jgi:ureidoacrylate peracid hydrolase